MKVAVRRVLVAAAACVAVLTGAGITRAQEAPEPSSLVGMRPAGVGLTAQLGFTSVSDPGIPHFGGSVLAGAQAVGHVGPFELGVATEAATNLAASRTAISGLGGVGLRIGHFYGEALFELGKHDYWSVGETGAFSTGTPGVDGSLPFAGARLIFTLPPRRIGHDGVFAGLGFLSLFVRHDLGEDVIDYTWQKNTGYTCCGATYANVNSSAVLGGVLEVGIAVGAGFDVL